MSKHDFYEFMSDVKDAIAKEYTRVGERAVEDPGTAGDQIEESWAKFLRGWLPSNYPIVTKGRLLFPDETSSPQLDILILSPTYPEQLRDRKYYFSGGVVAAFECKLTLKKDGIRKTFRNAAEIKRHTKVQIGSPYKELFQSPYIGLLAHSHVWKGKDRVSKIYDRIEEFQVEFAESPREQLDILCVADTATFALAKSIEIGSTIPPSIKQDMSDIGIDEAITSMYTMQHEADLEGNWSPQRRGDILASLLFSIIKHMAQEDTSIRSWWHHLGELGIFGGIGRPIFWTPEILSQEVLTRIREEGLSQDSWSHWRDVM